MNVLHVNTYDKLGAARAALNFHYAMLNSGINSKVLVLNKTIEDPNIIHYPIDLHYRIAYRLKHFVFALKTDPNYYFYNLSEAFSLISVKKALKLINFKPDVIIFHWISDFIIARDIYKFGKYTGAVMYWCGLDMAPLTGGCHYAWECKGYQKDCNFCPAILTDKQKNRAFKNLKKKIKYLSDSKISFIAPTSSLEEQAKLSSLFSSKNVIKIFLSIDNNIFKPANRNDVRKILNIPLNKKIILIGSLDIEEKRKGFSYLSKALHHLNEVIDKITREEVLLLVIGEKRGDIHTVLPFETLFMGRINDDAKLAMIYQASDLYVCSSIEDAGPMMINEAIMCGTPVVAFDNGVAKDLVHSFETGYRAILKDYKDMAFGIKEILLTSDKNYKNYKVNCSNLVSSKLSRNNNIKKLIQNIEKQQK